MVPMRCVAVVGGVLVMMSVSAAAQTARWATVDDLVAKEMIAKERMWANGNCSPKPELKDVIADEFRGTATDGRRYGKAQAIESDLQNLDRQCRLGEVKIQFFGQTLAVAYENESSIRKGKDRKEYLRCLAWTDTWLKRNGKWQIIAAQDAAVECKK